MKSASLSRSMRLGRFRALPHLLPNLANLGCRLAMIIACCACLPSSAFGQERNCTEEKEKSLAREYNAHSELVRNMRRDGAINGMNVDKFIRDAEKRHAQNVKDINDTYHECVRDAKAAADRRAEAARQREEEDKKRKREEEDRAQKAKIEADRQEADSIKRQTDAAEDDWRKNGPAGLSYQEKQKFLSQANPNEMRKSAESMVPRSCCRLTASMSTPHPAIVSTSSASGWCWWVCRCRSVVPAVLPFAL